MSILTDWRLWLSIGFVGLVALTAFQLVEGARARAEALQTAQDVAAAQIDLREASTRRIDQLNDRISELSDRLAEANDSVRRLEGQVADLHAQVVQLGGDPVVVRDTERVVVRDNPHGETSRLEAGCERGKRNKNTGECPGS